MNRDMEVDLIYYELKLQSLLEKFLENGYHIKNDVYFNRLLSFLGGKESKELAEVLLKLPLMAEWIVRAVKLWEDNPSSPDHSISAFTLQLLGLISKNEPTFINLLKFDIYNRAIKVLDVRNPKALPTIKLGFIKLLTSLLAHPSGREWLIQTTYWQDILLLSVQCQTVYIMRDGHNFISSFLLTMLQHNETFCSRVWQTIIKPLLIKPTERFKNQGNHFEVNDDEIERFLGPTIRLIHNILEFIFEKSLDMQDAHIKKFKHILSMMPMIESVTNYLHVVRDQNFSFELGRIWVLLLYLSMTFEVNNGVIKPDIEKDLMEPVFSLLNIFLNVPKNISILKSLNFVLLYWYKLTAKIKVEYIIGSDKSLSFEEQFVILHLNPLFLFCKNVCDVEGGKEFKLAYFSKIFAKLSRNSIRFSYSWRYSLNAEEIPFDLGPKILSYLFQLKTLLSRDSAILIFQSLLFTFYDVNLFLHENPNFFPNFKKYDIYLRTLLEKISELILYFNFSWKDSVESICVIQSSVQFLSIPTWSSKLVIADLNLLKVGISKYLSPELALIIDSKDESAISTLGPLLQAKLHDPEWSVRDSALEVISQIAEVSYIEFQSFQKVILHNDLCNLVLQMSLFDGESFVKASAIKCFNQLVQIDVFWKKHMDGPDIIKKMTTVLRCETEGIVRTEAAKLLATIFKKYDIDSFLHSEIYRTMNLAATEDLHWEVRLSSLSFWNDRVEQKLNDQGMLDGEFPDCTFSPESKKIVNLTDAEIKKRVTRVLDDLSDIGCLTVLKHAISDDCDLQVSKKGLEVSKKLVDLIEKYKLGENITLDEVSPPSNDSCYFSIVASSPSPSMLNGDDIIDQIIGVSDTSLLKDVYNPGQHNTTVDVRVPLKHIVTTKEFILLTRKNFKSFVEEREKWIHSLDSLSSLLNDMLESYEASDTNTMDCY